MNSSLDGVTSFNSQSKAHKIHQSIKNMLSEEDFVKLNENIHNRLNAAQNLTQKIEEDPVNEEEGQSENDECVVLITRPAPTGPDLSPCNMEEDRGMTPNLKSRNSGESTPKQKSKYADMKTVA